MVIFDGLPPEPSVFVITLILIFVRPGLRLLNLNFIPLSLLLQFDLLSQTKLIPSRVRSGSMGHRLIKLTLASTSFLRTVQLYIPFKVDAVLRIVFVLFKLSEEVR